MGRFERSFGVSVVLLIALLFIPSQPSLARSPSFSNRIEGRVYDQNRVPVGDAFVELLNEVDSMIARTRTSTDGRFSFFGLSRGTFTVKVLPLGTNLVGQTQAVEVGMTTRSNTDVAYAEFYLQIRKTQEDRWQSIPSEAIFVQDVPAKAKDLYSAGMKAIDVNEADGVAKLTSALEAFPTYYDALIKLGHYYFTKTNYEKAYPYFLRAVDVNRRSYVGYYSCAYSFYRMNQLPAAIEAAKAAVLLNSSDYRAQLLYGTVLRLKGDFADAESALLKAKSLNAKKNPDVYLQLSLLHNRMARNKEAADELEEYLKLTPDNPDRKKLKDTIDRLRAGAKSS